MIVKFLLLFTIFSFGISPAIAAPDQAKVEYLVHQKEQIKTMIWKLNTACMPVEIWYDNRHVDLGLDQPDTYNEEVNTKTLDLLRTLEKITDERIKQELNK